jgi:hypothetical protein
MSVHAALVGLAVIGGAVLVATTLGLFLVRLGERIVQRPAPPEPESGSPAGNDLTP